MTLNQCAVQTCTDQPYIQEPLLLCRQHALMVSISVTDALHANALNGHTTTGLDVERATVAPGNVWYQPSHPAIVYFLTNGDRVKIGTSTNITGRVSALALRKSNAALLLDGGHDLEGSLHDHFESDRIGSTEWFVFSPRIREYIKRRKDADAALKQPHLPPGENRKPEPSSALPKRTTKLATAEQKILKVLSDNLDSLTLKTYVHRNDIAYQAGVWASTLDNTLSSLVRAGKIHRQAQDGKVIRGMYGLGPAPTEQE